MSSNSVFCLSPTDLMRCTALAVTLLASASARAGALDEHQVRAATETWVRHLNVDARPDVAVVWMEAQVAENRTFGYIAHLAGGGFCLCGATEAMLPVYIYAPHGDFDPDNPGAQAILRFMDAKHRELEALPQDARQLLAPSGETRAERADCWARLIAGKLPGPQVTRAPRTAPSYMELNWTNEWHQGSPYNDLIPELIPGYDSLRCVVGCCATSLSQIMHYWKWPPVGEGTGSVEYVRRFASDWLYVPTENPNPVLFPGEWEDPDIPSGLPNGPRLQWQEDPNNPEIDGWLGIIGYWDYSIYDNAHAYVNNDPNSHFWFALDVLWLAMVDASVECEADFGTTAYDWSVIQSAHTDPPTDPGDAEIAKVCHHAGIAADISYRLHRTVGGPDSVLAGMQDHLRFAEDGRVDTWTGWSSVEDLTEEITWLRPALMGGCSHAWTIYGYDTGYDPHRRFLMNMGWGGWTAYCWYTTDGTNPNWCDTVEVQTRWLVPDTGVAFIGSADFGDGTPSAPYKNFEEALLEAPDDTTLIFQAGSVHTLLAPQVIISRPMTLRGYNVTIQ